LWSFEAFEQYFEFFQKKKKKKSEKNEKILLSGVWEFEHKTSIKKELNKHINTITHSFAKI